MFRQAVADAFRVSLSTPATSCAIVVTLALGTGLNSAMVAPMYGILFRPLPYSDAPALARIDQEIPLGQLEEWRARLQTVDRVAAFATAPHVLRGIGAPHSVRAAFVTGEFFEVLGVQAAVGRTFDSAGGAPGVVLSRTAASAAGVDLDRLLGRQLTIAGFSLPVIGIVPSSVSFPADGTELWIPASAAPAVALRGQADDRRFRLVARLKHGTTLQHVSEDAVRVRNELASASSRGDTRRIPVVTIRDHLYGDVRPLLLVFLAGAGVVLIVASANVATLLLERAATRDREIAVRVALGAGHARILASLFMEALVLAITGSALGAGLAFGATQLVRANLTSTLPRLDAVAVDWPVLGLALLVGLLVALGCTIGPGLCALRTNVTPLLRSFGAPGARLRRRTTAGLVVAQIALSTILLVCGGLLVRSVARLLSVDLGVETGSAVTMRVMLSDTMQLVKHRAPLVQSLLDEIRALPGVRQAGIGVGLPPNHADVLMTIRVVEGTRDETVRMHLIPVSPGYLEALGARLISGRLVEQQDLTSEKPIVVISRSVARGLFGDRQPVDRDLAATIPGSGDVRPRVIGLVDDVHYDGLDAMAGGAVYVPWNRLPLSVVSLVVRMSGAPLQPVAAIRGILQRLDPGVPVEDVVALESVAARSIAERRLQLLIAVGFATLTLTIAVLGLVAVLLRSIAERRHELAIRAAIGSSPEQTRRSVLLQAAGLTALGLACGLLGAAGAARGLSRSFFGIRPYDPLTFAGIALAILAIALLACLIPATRASRIDPAEVLRSV
jgi:putative ABC transport system permease protein